MFYFCVIITITSGQIIINVYIETKVLDNCTEKNPIEIKFFFTNTYQDIPNQFKNI